MSFFPERTRYLIGQGLHEVGQHGSAAGGEEGLDRHARRQGKALQFLQFRVRQADANRVEARAAALVDAERQTPGRADCDRRH